MHRSTFCVLALALNFGGAALRAQETAPSIPTPAAISSPAADTIATIVKPSTEEETIVFIRHGEKPLEDKGQLTCQGLNRALALPKVLVGKFGRPDYIFAPLTNTYEVLGHSFSYVRPLMTIEPTAITVGLPVNTRYGAAEIGPLQKELTSPAYRHSLIFVAWEHKLLVLCVRHLLEALGDTADKVPEWPGSDYDHIYIVKIRTAAGARTAAFSEDREMLDGLSDVLPTITVPPGDAH